MCHSVKRGGVRCQPIQGLDRGQQVTRAQMRIPQRHAEGLVPEDSLNIFQRASLHGEMARACVP